MYISNIAGNFIHYGSLVPASQIRMHSVLSPLNLNFILTKLYCDWCAGRKVLDL